MPTRDDPVPPAAANDAAETARTASPRDGNPRRRVRMLAVGLAGLVVGGGGGFAALQAIDRGDETSAAEGAEGTRTFDGVPSEMPGSLVPADASGVEGTVARRDEAWSAAVQFEVEGDHEQLARSADTGMADDGFTMRQRAYDDDVMQVIYDGEDGSVLTVTYLRADTGEPVRISAVLVSP